MGIIKDGQRSNDYIQGLHRCLMISKIRLHSKLVSATHRQVEKIVEILRDQMAKRVWDSYMYDKQKNSGKIKNDLLITYEMAIYFITQFQRDQSDMIFEK